MVPLASETDTIMDWGVDSEYGELTDVLLCRPDHFRWLATSAIFQATLDSEAKFDRDLGLRQHAEMVASYEEAGIRCHFLEPDSALPTRYSHVTRVLPHPMAPSCSCRSSGGVAASMRR